MVSHIVPDWSGGTRIGEAVAGFNRLWAKRVLGQGAIVLLFTDGLERDDKDELEKEINSRKKPAPVIDKQSSTNVEIKQVAGPVDLKGNPVKLMEISDPKIREIRDQAAAKPGAIVEQTTIR